MSKERDFAPGDPIPATFADALTEFLGSAAPNFRLRVRAADPTVLEVPAGTGSDQTAIAIQGRWRWVTATVSRGGITGTARTLDVYATAASDNSYSAGSPGEVDNTNRAFALAITESSVAPTGVTLSRKIGTARWDGTKFAYVLPSVGWGSGRDTVDRIVRGRVNADGSVGSGSGFTAARTSVGGYTVTFSPTFDAQPIVVVSAYYTTADAASRRFVHIGTAVQAASFTVETLDSTGAGIDSAFSFIAASV